MRASWNILSIVFCVLLISSCSFGYQRYIMVTMNAENDIVLFSSVESIGKEIGMVLLKREADAKGRTILSYVDTTKVQERRVGISVLREKIEKDGQTTYLVSCGVYGREPIEETVTSRVNSIFDLLLKTVKALESDGYLKIQEIN